MADYADLFLGETFGSVAEAELFDEFKPTGRPVWLSVTLEDVGVKVGQSKLRSGEPLSDLLALSGTSHRTHCCLIVRSQR